MIMSSKVVVLLLVIMSMSVCIDGRHVFKMDEEFSNSLIIDGDYKDTLTVNSEILSFQLHRTRMEDENGVTRFLLKLGACKIHFACYSQYVSDTQIRGMCTGSRRKASNVHLLPVHWTNLPEYMFIVTRDKIIPKPEMLEPYVLDRDNHLYCNDGIFESIGNGKYRVDIEVTHDGSEEYPPGMELFVEYNMKKPSEYAEK